MMNLSLQLPAQALRNVFGRNQVTEREAYAPPDTRESTWTRAGDGADDYLLPSGIESIEHWLDLNA